MKFNRRSKPICGEVQRKISEAVLLAERIKATSGVLPAGQPRTVAAQEAETADPPLAGVGMMSSEFGPGSSDQAGRQRRADQEDCEDDRQRSVAGGETSLRSGTSCQPSDPGNGVVTSILSKLAF